MFILLKLDSAKFGASNFFFESYRRKPLRCRLDPPPGKGRMTSDGFDAVSWTPSNLLYGGRIQSLPDIFTVSLFVSFTI